MKKFLKVIGIIAAFIVVIIAIVFLGTSWVRDAANEVVDQISQWQLEAVYNSSALVSIMSYNDFAGNMWVGTPMSIENAKLRWWNGRGFENSEKYIYGTFVFEDWTEEILTFWFEKVEDEYIFLGITWWEPETSDF